METPAHYTLSRVEAKEPDPRSMATAAIKACGICHQAISGSGGPGQGQICEPCGDAVKTGDSETLKARIGPPAPSLKWVDDPLGKREKRVSVRRLLLGGIEVATMTRREKWWSGWLDLPGGSLPKEYAPEEAMAKMIEDAVRAWHRESLRAL